MTTPMLPDRPFTWREACDLGVRRPQLTTLVAQHAVRRLFQGVYSPMSIADTIESRCAAVALVLRPSEVVCDRTAAWIYGVDTFAHAELELFSPLDTFVLRDSTRARRQGCRSGERDWAPEDITEVGGLPITTPLRTALDLGCSMSRRDSLAVLDGFMRVCAITIEDLDCELPRFRGRRGVVQLRRLIPLATSLAESPGESWMRMAVIDAGLPVPTPQVPARDEYGEPVFWSDLGYELARVGLEYLGEIFHRSKEKRAADAKRKKWMEDRGWTIIDVTKSSFAPDTLPVWLKEVDEALAATKPWPLRRH